MQKDDISAYYQRITMIPANVTILLILNLFFYVWIYLCWDCNVLRHLLGLC